MRKTLCNVVLCRPSGSGSVVVDCARLLANARHQCVLCLRCTAVRRSVMASLVEQGLRTCLRMKRQNQAAHPLRHNI